MSFVFWKIVFFSIIPLASASIVDKSYTTNREDVYDAILNTLFPIAFVVLAKVSGESGKIKKTLLPMLDDLLYNTVTWVIPLIVSIAYDDSLSIKIFSLVNMGLHVVCAAIALIQNKKISDKYELFDIPFCFLMSFPVIFIPIFWIVYIRIAYLFDPIGILFITLFGILLVLAPVYFIVRWFYVKKYSHSYGNNVYIGYVHAALMALMFYAPNILQTFLIVLYWPISFYFVKSCIFILVLSLTRNISYFTDKVPDDYLATSTTYTQYLIKDWVKFNFTGSKQKDNVMSAVMKKIEENEKEIKRMIRDNEDEINRLKEIMMNKGIGDRGGEKDTTITVIQ